MQVGSRRRVAVVTGTRAEWGLLRPVVAAMAERSDLAVGVLAVGWHRVSGTVAEARGQVEASGAAWWGEVEMQRAGEVGRWHDAAALGRGVAGLSERLSGLAEAGGLDWVVVLGDRIEALAGALAGSVGGVRVAHLHGGDRAEGVADEAMRHAISKLAHLHLPATAGSAERLRRMGEADDAVVVVGSPAIDGLDEVEAEDGGPGLIVLRHPVGATDEQERVWMEATLSAARSVAGKLGVKWALLGPNGDPGRAGIVSAIEAAGVEPIDHLPRKRWLAWLKGARVIVGNSSAGLIEASALGTACVNLGQRQLGREQAGNAVDCRDPQVTAIESAIEAALRLDLSATEHPYGDGRAGLNAAHALATIELDRVPIRKRNAY
ncbi:MAG: UDP-N-acetylglucosamine 2-epimerase [Planctomycetota bacterium]